MSYPLFTEQLHLAALGSLRGEISELHGRLQRAAQDRDTLEQALAKTQVLLFFILFIFSPIDSIGCTYVCFVYSIIYCIWAGLLFVVWFRFV